MKRGFIYILVVFLIACNQSPATGTFGEKFDNKSSQDFKLALSEYSSGKDTIYTISGKIENVCQHKGCWFTFLNDSTEFRLETNEVFTLPKNSKGKKATAKGRFVKDEDGVVGFEPTGVIIE